jgi:hypothetical protein
MESDHFGALTRTLRQSPTRRDVSRALGVAPLDALGFLGIADIDAHKRGKKGKRGNKKTKSEPCKKLGVGCNPDQHTCCDDSAFQPVASMGGKRCCQSEAFTPCTSNSECCDPLTCVSDGTFMKCFDVSALRDQL